MQKHVLQIFAAVFITIMVISLAATAAIDPRYQWHDGYDGTDPNTVGLWYLDGDATNAVNSLGDGVASAGVSYSAAMFGSGASLGGPASGETILIAKDSGGYTDIMFQKNSFTVECWINPSSPQTTGWTSLVCVPYSFNVERKQGSTYAKQIQFSVYNGGNTALMRQVMSTSEVNDNEWTHVACTLDYDLDNGSTLSIYINGALDAQFITEAGWYNWDGYWFDMGIGYNPGLADREFDGVIDEVRISNVAREFISADSGPAPPGGYDGTAGTTLGLWKFDEGTGSVVANSVAGGNDGTASAAFGWNLGKYGYGGEFAGPGSGSSVEVVKSPDMRLEYTSFTAECWIKPDSPSSTGWTSLIAIPYGFNVERKQASTDAELIQFSVYNGGNPANMRKVKSVSQVPAGEWTHVACVLEYNSDPAVGSVLSIYLNGELDTQTTTEGSWYNYDGYWHNLCIGYNLGVPDREFDGVIDEVRISNVAIKYFDDRDNQTEAINPAFQWYYGWYGDSHIDNNTTGLWHYDENFGTLALNAITGGDNMTLNDTGSLASWDAGKFGDSSLLLNGADNRDFAEVVSYPGIEFRAQSFTVDFWVKPHASYVPYHTLYIANKSHAFDIVRRTAGAGAESKRIIFATWASGTTQRQIISNAQIQPDAWTHVACVWDELTKTQSIYINGELDQQATFPNSMWDGSNAPLRIGDYVAEAGHSFDGQIDELRLSNCVRTFAPQDYRYKGAAALSGMKFGTKIVFQTEAGEFYDIEYMDAGGTWTSMNLNVPGTGSEVVYYDIGDATNGVPAPPMDESRQYRVIKK